jgi:hypothetical protein
MQSTRGPRIPAVRSTASRDKEPIDVTLVEPFVIEVTVDVAWSGTFDRHPLRLAGARPDSVRY